MPGEKWLDGEIEYLQDHYTGENVNQVTIDLENLYHMGRTRRAVAIMAMRVGKSQKRVKFEWDKPSREFVIHYYPTMTNQELAEALHISTVTLQREIQRLFDSGALTFKKKLGGMGPSRKLIVALESRVDDLEAVVAELEEEIKAVRRLLQESG
jgi:hypothetical protein